MRFTGLTATEFTLLFASAAFLAVLFYLLSFRRRTVVMATDPLWRKVIGRRRTPYRKLLALLGQLLILFFLSLSLADPRAPHGGAAPPVAVVIALDSSASMAAVETSGSRLDIAKKLVLQIVDSMGPRDRLALFSVDKTCHPLATYTSHSKDLRLALDGLSTAALADDSRAALGFAMTALDPAVAGKGFTRRLILISDHFHDLPAEQAEVEIYQVAVGKTSGNLAVNAFDVRPRRGAGKGSEVFVEITNFGRRRAKTRLSIHTSDALLGEEILKVPARGKVSRSYFMRPLSGQRLMATLTAAGGQGSPDVLAVDDRAYALVRETTRRKIVLVSDGNIYLEKALALNPSVDVEIVKPAAFNPASLAGVQAAVFDGICPPARVPALYFNPPRSPGCPFSPADRVSFPKLSPLKGDHALTEGITLIDLQIQEATRLRPRGKDIELLRDSEAPLIIAREENGNKLIGVGFDLARSDLPLRVAFPLFLHNCIDWFTGQAIAEEIWKPAVGSLLDLPEWVNETASVIDPSGRRVSPRRLGSKWQLRPRLPGFYRIESANESKGSLLAVNFQLEKESDLVGDRSPGPARVRWNGGDPPQELIKGFDKNEYPEPPLHWPTLLVVVAWLLLFDWVFYVFRILF